MVERPHRVIGVGGLPDARPDGLARLVEGRVCVTHHGDDSGLDQPWDDRHSFAGFRCERNHPDGAAGGPLEEIETRPAQWLEQVGSGHPGTSGGQERSFEVDAQALRTAHWGPELVGHGR